MPSSSIVLIFCMGVSAAARLPHGETYEVDTDGGDVALSVGIIGEPEQQARLADTRVSDEEELEEVVVSDSGARLARAMGVAARGLFSSPSVADAERATLQKIVVSFQAGPRESWRSVEAAATKARGGGDTMGVTYYSGFIVATGSGRAGISKERGLSRREQRAARRKRRS